MSSLPLDEAQRDGIRAEVLDAYALRAYKQAKDHRVSLRCQKGDHRCHNDGTGCLCRCHDRRSSI